MSEIVRTTPWFWRALAAACAFSIVACDGPPVTWMRETRRIAVSDTTDRLTVDSTGLPTTSSVPRTEIPGACTGSVRVVTDARTRYAVWWTAAPAGPAKLQFARSGDGVRWSDPVTVDARDAGSRGCARPPIAFAMDRATRSLHLVYWMEPAEGAGVFFVHSMDAGAMFHAPVAVSYGTRPVRADIAAVGDTIVIAHEDPNAPSPRLRLALSRTAGHIFEQRTGVPGEGTTQPAPRIALRGRRVYVGWMDQQNRTLIVRLGTLGNPPSQ